MDAKVQDLSKIGDPFCTHKLEDGSLAYEWRVYGIEYIKTCHICCELDYTTRTIYNPEPVKPGDGMTNFLVDQLIEFSDLLRNLKKETPCLADFVFLAHPHIDGSLEHRIAVTEQIIEDLKAALISRGVDVSKYVIMDKVETTQTLLEKER